MTLYITLACALSRRRKLNHCCDLPLAVPPRLRPFECHRRFIHDIGMTNSRWCLVGVRPKVDLASPVSPSFIQSPTLSFPSSPAPPPRPPKRLTTATALPAAPFLPPPRSNGPCTSPPVPPAATPVLPPLRLPRPRPCLQCVVVAHCIRSMDRAVRRPEYEVRRPARRDAGAGARGRAGARGGRGRGCQLSRSGPRAIELFSELFVRRSPARDWDVRSQRGSPLRRTIVSLTNRTI